MSKQLSVIRHAKSDWSAGCRDFDRALNDRGCSDAQLIGDYLIANNQPFDRLYCSKANRARLTLQELNHFLTLPEDSICYEQSLYLAPVAHLVSFIEQLSDQDQHVALIAHNPGLTELCNYLTGDRLSNLPTCAVYSIQLLVDEWKSIGPDCGTKKSLMTPRTLKDN
ncbi:MAG: histidine phosphatase family protein [Gammaproteobacteria bacterium]